MDQGQRIRSAVDAAAQGQGGAARSVTPEDQDYERPKLHAPPVVSVALVDRGQLGLASCPRTRPMADLGAVRQVWRRPEVDRGQLPPLLNDHRQNVTAHTRTR